MVLVETSFILLFGLLGLFVGVLINRASDNLPPPASRGLLAAPRCPYCGRAREPLEQSGLTNATFFGGRCRDCGARRGLRPPLVELATVLLFAFLAARLGPGVPLFIYALVTALLLLITVIDLEHRLILNVVVLPATLLAFLLVPLAEILLMRTPPRNPGGLFLNALLGMLLGYLIVFGIYVLGDLFARAMARARGQTIDEVAFGMGDVKLAGMAGAIAGFTFIFHVLIFTILLGGVVSLLVIIYQFAVHRRYAAFMAIPYGPFFTITTWIMMAASAGIWRGLLS